MTWIELRSRPALTTEPSASVAISATKGWPRIIVRLNKALVDRWQAEQGQHVTLLVSKLADAGLLQLTKANGDGVKLTRGGKNDSGLQAAASLSELGIRPEAIRSVRCPHHEISDDRLLLSLPGAITRALAPAIEPGKAKK